MSFHPSVELNHSMSNRIMMFLMFVSLFCNALTSFRIGKAKMVNNDRPLLKQGKLLVNSVSNMTKF